MQKRVIASAFMLMVVIASGIWGGMIASKKSAQPLQQVVGVWTGKSQLQTSTGLIDYDVSALVEGSNILLSLVAETECHAKFAFKLNLEYIKHNGAEYVFSVRNRQTIWLDQLRTNEHFDIPVLGHLLVATLATNNEGEFYFSYDLGPKYAFGTLFKRGV